jgi:predicted aspartyl protease
MISRRNLLAALPALGAAASAARAGAQASASAAGAPPRGPLIGQFHLTANRPWTGVEIEGQGPFRFVIDTGASVAVVDPDLAVMLGLSRVEDAQLQGATAQRTTQMFVGHGVIVAGALRQRGAVTFAAGEVGGDFAGILPGAMFSGTNSEIDFAAREFRIYGPTPPDRTGFVRLPLVRDPMRPRDLRMVVRVELDGRPVELLIDTGGTGSILLSAEYVGLNDLFQKYSRYTSAEGTGMVSAFALRLVRAESLDLGPIRMERPVIQLTDPFNPPGDAGDGVLGMDVLRRFTLATDPAGGALWLKPNAAIDEPFRYNRAGFEARFEDGVGVVRKVLTASPADRAGIEVGDKLPTVTNLRDLARFDWFLTEEPGTRLDIELQRDGRRFPVSLVLEELI